MTTPLQAISSMATRQVLADLADLWQQRSGQPIHITSVGGVDAARRVQAGEPFDIVFLAVDAIERLHTAGCITTGSQVDLMRSSTCVAIAQNAPIPDIHTEPALRAAILAAPSIGYSTGPSGTALGQLFARWGIADTLQPRLRQAPPGVPVGRLIAQGTVALGFQQRSELIHIQGITIVGPLPADAAIDTVFSGAVTPTSQQREAAGAALAFMASPAADCAKRRQGMQPL